MKKKPPSFKKISFSIILTIVGAFLLISPILATATTTSSLNKSIQRIIETVIYSTGVLAFGILVYGGFKYMTAQGSIQAAKKARGLLIKGGTGLLIIISTVVLANAVNPGMFDEMPIPKPGDITTPTSTAPVYPERDDLENVYQEIPFGTIIENRILGRNMSCYKNGRLVDCESKEEFTSTELNRIKDELKDGSYGDLDYQGAWDSNRIGAYPSPTTETAKNAFKCYRFDGNGNIIFENDKGDFLYVSHEPKGESIDVVYRNEANKVLARFDYKKDNDYLSKHGYTPSIIENQDRLSCLQNTIQAFQGKAGKVVDDAEKIKDWTGFASSDGCSCKNCVCPSCGAYDPLAEFNRLLESIPDEIKKIINFLLKPDSILGITDKLQTIESFVKGVQDYIGAVSLSSLLGDLQKGTPDWVKNSARALSEGYDKLREVLTPQKIRALITGFKDDQINDLREKLSEVPAVDLYGAIESVSPVDLKEVRESFNNLTTEPVQEIASILGFDLSKIRELELDIKSKLAELEEATGERAEEIKGEVNKLKEDLQKEIDKTRDKITDSMPSDDLDNFKAWLLDTFEGNEGVLKTFLLNINNNLYLKNLLDGFSDVALNLIFDSLPISGIQDLLSEIPSEELQKILNVPLDDLMSWLVFPEEKIRAIIDHLSEEALNYVMNEVVDEALNYILDGLISILPIDEITSALTELPFDQIIKKIGAFKTGGCSGDPCASKRENINRIRQTSFNINQHVGGQKTSQPKDLINVPFQDFGKLSAVNQARYIGHKILVPQKAGLRADLDYLRKAENLYNQCRYGTVISHAELQQKINADEDVRVIPFCYNQKRARWGEVCIPEERVEIHQYCQEFNCVDCYDKNGNKLPINECDLDSLEVGTKIQEEYGTTTISSYKCSNYGINNEKGENSRRAEDQMGTICKTVNKDGEIESGYAYSQDPFTFYCPYPKSDAADDQEAYWNQTAFDYHLDASLDNGYKVSEIPVGEIIEDAERFAGGLIINSGQSVQQALHNQTKKIFNPDNTSDESTLYNIPTDCSCGCDFNGVTGCNCGCVFDIVGFITNMLRGLAVNGIIRYVQDLIEDAIPNAQEIKTAIRNEVRKHIRTWIVEKLSQTLDNATAEILKHIPIEQIKEIIGSAPEKLLKIIRVQNNIKDLVNHLESHSLQEIVSQIATEKLKEPLFNLALNQKQKLLNQITCPRLRQILFEEFPRGKLQERIKEMPCRQLRKYIQNAKKTIDESIQENIGLEEQKKTVFKQAFSTLLANINRSFNNPRLADLGDQINEEIDDAEIEKMIQSRINQIIQKKWNSVLNKLSNIEIYQIITSLPDNITRFIINELNSTILDKAFENLPMDRLKYIVNEMPEKYIRQYSAMLSPDYLVDQIDQWANNKIQQLINWLPMEWLKEISGAIQGVFDTINQIKSTLDPLLDFIDKIKSIMEWYEKKVKKIMDTVMRIVNALMQILSLFGGNPCICICNPVMCPSINMGPCPSTAAREAFLSVKQWFSGSMGALESWHKDNKQIIKNDLEPAHAEQELLLKITRENMTVEEVYNFINSHNFSNGSPLDIQLKDRKVFGNDVSAPTDATDISAQVTPWLPKETIINEAKNNNIISSGFADFTKLFFSEEGSSQSLNHEEQLSNILNYRTNNLELLKESDIKDRIEEDILEGIKVEKNALNNFYEEEEAWNSLSLPYIQNLDSTNVLENHHDIKESLQQIKANNDLFFDSDQDGLADVVEKLIFGNLKNYSGSWTVNSDNDDLIDLLEIIVYSDIHTEVNKGLITDSNDLNVFDVMEAILRKYYQGKSIRDNDADGRLDIVEKLLYDNVHKYDDPKREPNLKDSEIPDYLYNKKWNPYDTDSYDIYHNLIWGANLPSTVKKNFKNILKDFDLEKDTNGDGVADIVQVVTYYTIRHRAPSLWDRVSSGEGLSALDMSVNGLWSDLNNDGWPDIVEAINIAVFEKKMSDITDEDSDGLNNFLEQNLWSNTLNNDIYLDVDGDGIDDRIEEKLWGDSIKINSMNHDNDNDGLADVLEFLAFGDLNTYQGNWDVDSDNDGVAEIIEVFIYGTYKHDMKNNLATDLGRMDNEFNIKDVQERRVKTSLKPNGTPDIIDKIIDKYYERTNIIDGDGDDIDDSLESELWSIGVPAIKEILKKIPASLIQEFIGSDRGEEKFNFQELDKYYYYLPEEKDDDEKKEVYETDFDDYKLFNEESLRNYYEKDNINSNNIKLDGLGGVGRDKMMDIFSSKKTREIQKDLDRLIHEQELILNSWESNPYLVCKAGFCEDNEKTDEEQQLEAIANKEIYIKELKELRPYNYFINLLPSKWLFNMINEIPVSQINDVLIRSDYKDLQEIVASLPSSTQNEILSYHPREKINRLLENNNLSTIKNSVLSLSKESIESFLTLTPNDLEYANIENQEASRLINLMNADEIKIILEKLEKEKLSQLGEIIKDLPKEDLIDIFGKPGEDQTIEEKIDKLIEGEARLYSAYLKELGSSRLEKLMPKIQNNDSKKLLLKTLPDELFKDYLYRIYKNKIDFLAKLDQLHFWQRHYLEEKHEEEIGFVEKIAHILYKEVTDVQEMIKNFEEQGSPSIKGTAGNIILERIGGWDNSGDESFGGLSYNKDNTRIATKKQTLGSGAAQNTPPDVSRTEIINKLTNIRKKMKSCVTGYGSKEIGREDPREIFSCSILLDKQAAGEMSINPSLESCYPYNAEDLDKEEVEACANNRDSDKCIKGTRDKIENYYCLDPIQ